MSERTLVLISSAVIMKLIECVSRSKALRKSAPHLRSTKWLKMIQHPIYSELMTVWEDFSLDGSMVVGDASPEEPPIVPHKTNFGVAHVTFGNPVWSQFMLRWRQRVFLFRCLKFQLLTQGKL